MKHFVRFYIVMGTAVCLWLTVAAFAGWKAPSLGVVDGGSGFFGPSGYHSGGRGSGGFWGGGK